MWSQALCFMCLRQAKAMGVYPLVDYMFIPPQTWIV